MDTIKVFQKVKDKKIMRRFFEKIIKEFFPPGSSLVDLTIRDIGKLSFKKALRYTLRIKTPEGKITSQIMRGNVPADSSKKEIKIADETQRTLYLKGFAFIPFHVPLSLGYYPKLNLILYEEYPGLPFSEFLKKNPKNLAQITRHVALWLARFHDLKIKKGEVKSFSVFEKEAERFKESYKNYYPGIYATGATVIERVLPRLKKTFEQKESFILTHGDFNPKNIIIKGLNVAVIDWGSSFLFNPLSDVANFVCQLNVYFWRNKASPHVIRRVKRIFVETYLEARDIKYRHVKKELLLFQIWWILQIVDYTVSVYITTDSIKRIAMKGMYETKQLCRSLGITIRENRLEERRRSSMKKIFTNEEILMKYFNKNLISFFPQAKNIISLEIEQPGALSTTSFLTRSTLLLNLGKNVKATKVVRGNIITPNTFRIMKYLYERRSREIISPRLLFYFKNIPYILYEEIPGRILRKIPFRSNQFPRYVRKAGEALANLHNLPVLKVNSKNITENSFFRDVRTKIHKYDPDNLPKVKKYIEIYQNKAKRNFKNAKRVISHNDYQASNIVVTNDNKIALIDFTLSSLFYPSCDVANFMTHLDIMLEGIYSKEKIVLLQNSFFHAYIKRVRPSLARQVKQNVNLMKVRAALDVWAVTATLLGPKDINRAKYVTILEKIINNNLK